MCWEIGFIVIMWHNKVTWSFSSYTGACYGSENLFVLDIKLPDNIIRDDVFFNKHIMIMWILATMFEQPITAIQKIISSATNSSSIDAFRRWSHQGHALLFLSSNGSFSMLWAFPKRKECSLISLRTFWYALVNNLHSVFSCSAEEQQHSSAALVAHLHN